MIAQGWSALIAGCTHRAIGVIGRIRSIRLKFALEELQVSSQTGDRLHSITDVSIDGLNLFRMLNTEKLVAVPLLLAGGAGNGTDRSISEIRCEATACYARALLLGYEFEGSRVGRE